MKRCLVWLLLLASAALAKEPTIAEQSRSKKPADRERAAERLGEQGDKQAVKMLLPLLKDRDWGVRLAATRSLAPIRSTAGRNALRAQLRTGATSVIRLRTAQLLKQHGDASLVIEIVKDLGRARDDQRYHLIEALGILGTSPGVAALKRQMRAQDVRYRIAAARALGELAKGLETLIDGLKDKEDEVRWLSAVGISGIDSSTGRAAILKWIEKQHPKRPAPGYVLRRVARRGAKVNRAELESLIAKALPGTRHPKSLLLLAWHGRLTACAGPATRHLRSRDGQTRALALQVVGLARESLTLKDVKSAIAHKDDIVRYSAAQAYLRAAKDPKAALEDVLASKHRNVLLVGIRFAADHKRKDAIPALLALAKGETDAKKAFHARAAACVAFGRLARADAFSDLVALAEERRWHIRAAALEGLVYTWKKEAIPVYLKFFADKNTMVRKVARTNLRYMSGKRFAKREKYEQWWKKVGPKLELVHPDDVVKKFKVERDKYGYAVNTRRHLQKVLGSTEILVLRGRWDFVEKVLVDLDVEHTAVFAQKVKDLGLTPKQIVLVNCEGTTDGQTTDYLRWFVATGGYAATTDWALVNAVSKTFPRVLLKYAKKNTGNDVVIVEPGLPGSPLLEGAFPFGVKPKWWLEVQAFPLVLDDPVRAEVLVDSFEMLSRYGSSPMLVEFQSGLGKVIHSTSHFFLAKEGFSNFGSAAERKLFAADHLGLSAREIRELEAKGFFDQMKETTPISRSYSMFAMLVNFIKEKQAIDVNLR